MLERFLRVKAVERGINAHIESVGVHKDAKKKKMPSPHTIIAMRRHGVRIQDHRSRYIDRVNISDFDLIVAMTDKIASEIKKLSPRGRILVAGVENPITWKLNSYRDRAARLKRVAKEIVSAL